VGLAARGSRHMGAEIEKIDNEAELTQVRRQANQVNIKATAVALLLTLLTLLL